MNEQFSIGFFLHIIMTYAYTSCDFFLNQCSWLAPPFFIKMHHVYFVCFFFVFKNSKHKSSKLWSQSHKWEAVKIDWNWQMKRNVWIASFRIFFFCLGMEYTFWLKSHAFCDQFRNVLFIDLRIAICVIVPYWYFVCDHLTWSRWLCKSMRYLIKWDRTKSISFTCHAKWVQWASYYI